jgi:MoaA/NifB/PqqE/SkfB family radical SAM enzyme
MVMRRARHYAKKSRLYEEVISIETTLSCNSRCVFCGHHDKIMTGTMTTELYEKIIDECHEYGIKTIFFGVYGEFMTDKYMFEKINYLRKYGMKYGFITNASLLTQEITDKLLTLGDLVFVNFSVNGFSKEVYENTMVGLKRDTTYKNILYFLDQIEKRKVSGLDVVITAVRTNLNKNDLKNFYLFWRKQKCVSSIIPIELMDRMGKEYEGEFGELGAMNNEHNWLAPCKYVWESVRVYYDGKVSSCCKEDDERKFLIGDLVKQSLKEILNGEQLKNLRQCHISGNRWKHPTCGKCYLNSIWFGQ